MRPPRWRSRPCSTWRAIERGRVQRTEDTLFQEYVERFAGSDLDDAAEIGPSDLMPLGPVSFSIQSFGKISRMVKIREVVENASVA
jgi:hypothetical protein